MERGYSKIFWGFMITIFNINLGTINILPDFLGFFIMGTGLAIILDEFKNSNFFRAQNIANLLFSYHLVKSLLGFVGFGEMLKGYDFIFRFEYLVTTGLGIIESCICLILAFYILSGTIELYLFKEQEIEAKHIERAQKKYTILYVIGIFLLSIMINVSSEVYVTMAAIYILIVEIYYAKIISFIRKTFSQDIIEPMN